MEHPVETSNPDHGVGDGQSQVAIKQFVPRGGIAMYDSQQTIELGFEVLEP